MDDDYDVNSIIESGIRVERRKTYFEAKEIIEKYTSAAAVDEILKEFAKRNFKITEPNNPDNNPFVMVHSNFVRQDKSDRVKALEIATQAFKYTDGDDFMAFVEETVDYITKGKKLDG